jgi:hypothetical protein
MSATTLPYIDTQSVSVAAPPEGVYDGIKSTLPRFGGPIATAYARLVGADDANHAPVGFHVTEAERPRSLVLAGRHRFSRYELKLTIEPAAGGKRSTLRARTNAEFPGPHGKLYRLAVIGTRAHVVATRSILGTFKRRAERAAVDLTATRRDD